MYAPRKEHLSFHSAVRSIGVYLCARRIAAASQRGVAKLGLGVPRRAVAHEIFFIDGRSSYERSIRTIRVCTPSYYCSVVMCFPSLVRVDRCLGLICVLGYTWCFSARTYPRMTVPVSRALRHLRRHDRLCGTDTHPTKRFPQAVRNGTGTL